MNLHIGSSFDDLLEETGGSAEVSAVAIKRVVAWQVSQKMEKENISKTSMAKLMDTSRSAPDWLLDPTNTSVTLNTLHNAARAIGIPNWQRLPRYSKALKLTDHQISKLSDHLKNSQHRPIRFLNNAALFGDKENHYGLF